MSGHTVNICFHGVGTPRRDLEDGEAAYWVSESRFHQVLDLVADESRVRLSFDDANASDVEVGLPALLERGLSATFFVLAGRLDHAGSLSGTDVRTLAANGMRIGSHGMTHEPWRGLRGADLDRELVEARQVLAEVSRNEISEAALPLGRYDRRLLHRVRALGYRRLHTSDRLHARPQAWLQPRFSIRGTDTVDSVRSEVLAAPSRRRRAARVATIAAKRLR